MWLSTQWVRRLHATTKRWRLRLYFYHSLPLHPAQGEAVRGALVAVLCPASGGKLPLRDNRDPGGDCTRRALGDTGGSCAVLPSSS